jgi:hypothetical protein
MFTVEDRERVFATLLDWASADDRIISAAAVGGSSERVQDRWSDIDLTFGVVDDVGVPAVLDDWTQRVSEDGDAPHLFDVTADGSLYRVFLFPGNLQVDLSFTPATRFGARTARFALLFGEAHEREVAPPPSAAYLYGFGAHHALRGRICVERGRLWQAEHWISATRDQALGLACLARGLESSYARGVHELPADVTARYEDALVRSLERDELLRVLRLAVDGLIREGGAFDGLDPRIARRLRELV